MAIFKTYKHPVTQVVLTDANTKFVSAISGSDANTGTRDAAKATVTSAMNTGNIIMRGRSVENVSVFNTGTSLIGDGEDAEVNGTISCATGTLINMKITSLSYAHISSIAYVLNCNIGTNSISSGIARYCIFKYNFVTNHNSGFASGSSVEEFSSNTILNLKNYINSTNNNICKNTIFVTSVDLYNYISRSTTTYYPVFQYCLFRKLTTWKWNGATITINWTTNPNTSVAYTTETLLERVYQSLLYYANSLSAGTDKTYFLAILASNTTMFYADTNGQTNKVVDDIVYPIFNLYNGTTPVDYSLKLDANNVALTMSDAGSYVGAYKANLGNVQFGSIINVNSDGSDDLVTTPTLLVSDGYNQFSANDASTQSRNRIRTIVQSYPRGKAMAGAGSQLTSGLASRIYFGKKRPMVTSGSGFTIPVETFEVIPYDSVPSDNSVGAANDITGKSAFPRFSVAFNGATQMWYKANGTPLLFNDLATYSITTDVSLTEYGTWAVTSADAEDYDLSLIATANSLTKKNIPVVYCKQELNLNYV